MSYPGHELLHELTYGARAAFYGSLDAYLKSDQLQDYRPYPKQLEFHMAGTKYRNRLLRAGNQVGKTFSVGSEMAMHLTGEYPDNWKGVRYNRPIVAWATGQTGESTRDNPQRILLGPTKQVGTGVIPKRCITSIYGMAKGTVGLYDFVYVRHRSGGLSLLKFRYYAQGRLAWQGPPVDVVWFDEEPPQDIYSEGLARTIAVQGITMMSFTPLLGWTPVVNQYLQDPDPEFSGRYSVQMTLYDAKHLTPEQIRREIAKWPKHEQRARIYGEPALGVGQIYPQDPEEYTIDEPFSIPDHWARLAAIDTSSASKSPTAHPTAAVNIAYDRDDDVVYVTHEYRKKGKRPEEHWLKLRHWGRDLRWAWPKDAAKDERGTGEQLIQAYKDEGMRALPIHAQYPKKKKKKKSSAKPYHETPGSTVSVERGIIDVGARLDHGRLKIFGTCPMLLGEMRQYHRDEDEKVVKIGDDLVDALRYAIMMLRFASIPKATEYTPQDQPDGYLGI